jgi:hypothetical protein
LRNLTRFNSLFWQVSHIAIRVLLDSRQRVFVDKIDLKFVQQRIGFTNAITCFAQSSKSTQTSQVTMRAYYWKKQWTLLTSFCYSKSY